MERVGGQNFGLKNRARGGFAHEGGAHEAGMTVVTIDYINILSILSLLWHCAVEQHGLGFLYPRGAGARVRHCRIARARRAAQSPARGRFRVKLPLFLVDLENFWDEKILAK